jgi:hypothetical protein
VVKSHLIKRGFKKNYTIWTTHGVFDRDDHDIDDDDDDDFDFEELLRHVEPHVLNSMGTDRGLDNMEILEKSSREPLYDELNGCGKEFTQLRVMLELLKLKPSRGWSDNSFLDLLSLLAKLLPKPTHCPQAITERRSLYVSCP